MLDHQAARGVRQGAHAARSLALALLCALAAPAAAGAQLGAVPPSPPPPPGPESPALGGDAAHRNAWAGAGLRPPLEVAWQTEASPVHAALAVGPRVVVQTASAVKALAASDGSPLWSVPLPSPAEVATEGGRVYVATAAGVAALDIVSGELRWAVADSGASGPVVDAGRLLTGNAAGELVARQASTGAVLWRTDVGVARARPAVAGSRAYASGTCRAVSVDVALGLVAWRSGCARDTGTRTLLAGGAVISEDGPVLASADGTVIAPAGGPATIGGGLAFANPLGAAAERLLAFDAATFAPRWAWDPLVPARMLLRPAVVDDVVWQVADAGPDGLVLGALDAATGLERWTGFLPQPARAALAPATTTAVAVAPGLLLVPVAGGGLAALRNAPEGPLGVRATLPRNVVAAGDRTRVTGALVGDGHGLAGPRRVALQADRFPFGGGYRRVAATVAGRDGFRLDARIPRNTRLRLLADGVAHPPTTVYAQPSMTVSYRRTARALVVRATLRIAAEPGFDRAGRVGLYRLAQGATVASRMGAGRSGRSGVARFLVRIPPDLARTDRVLPCLRGSSRRGFGPPNVLDRSCGEARIEVPAQASASARRSLSTGTGSAMPLKRFMPASLKR